MLKLLKEVFPKEIVLPESHYKKKMKLHNLGLGYESIHVCKYDRALFCKENVDLKNECAVNVAEWIRIAKGKKNT